jgi:hypothetical protein
MLFFSLEIFKRRQKTIKSEFGVYKGSPFLRYGKCFSRINDKTLRKTLIRMMEKTVNIFVWKKSR